MNNGLKWVTGEGQDLRTIENKNLAFDTTSYANLMIADKGILSGTVGSVAHTFFYPVPFDAYIKHNNKYFVNYQNVAMTTYGFENAGGGGMITSLPGALTLTSDQAGKLVYIMYANPITYAEGVHIPGMRRRSGIVFSKSGKSVYDGHGARSFDTNYQMPLVIDEGVLQNTLPAISVPVDSTRNQTVYTDYTHNQPQANHIIVPNILDNVVAWAFNPYPFGGMGVREEISTEVYIDSTKIRFRSSRTIYNYPGGGGSTWNVDARTGTMPFYVTNIKLP